MSDWLEVLGIAIVLGMLGCSFAYQFGKQDGHQRREKNRKGLLRFTPLQLFYNQGYEVGFALFIRQERDEWERTHS